VTSKGPESRQEANQEEAYPGERNTINTIIMEEIQRKVQRGAKHIDAEEEAVSV